MKIKFLVKARKVKEAVEFSDKAIQDFPNKQEVLEWRAKACYYNGSEPLAKKAINLAFSIDPDSAEC
jgi:hypothetical protein